MTFCTAINCMDGRVQQPVIRYMQKRFDADVVDAITEPGPNKILAVGTDLSKIQSILERLEISIEVHESIGIAIIGHHDCEGNPAAEKEQLILLKKAVNFLKQKYDNIEIIGLWVDDNWTVHELAD
jgi:carbonic anhydrase